MQIEYPRFPATPIALKMAVAIGIGMLAGMEREWSNKDVGIRTFAIVALLGMLASLIGENVAIAALIGVTGGCYERAQYLFRSFAGNHHFRRSHGQLSGRRSGWVGSFSLPWRERSS